MTKKKTERSVSGMPTLGYHGAGRKQDDKEADYASFSVTYKPWIDKTESNIQVTDKTLV